MKAVKVAMPRRGGSPEAAFGDGAARNGKVLVPPIAHARWAIEASMGGAGQRASIALRNIEAAESMLVSFAEKWVRARRAETP